MSFLLPRSIFTLQHCLYPSNCFSGYLNYSVLLSFIPFPHTNPASPTIFPKHIDNLNFKLENFSDNIIADMGANHTPSLLIEALETLASTATIIPSALIQPLKIVFYPSISFLASSYIIINF